MTRKQATIRPAKRNGVTAPKRQGFIMYAWDLFDTARSAICCSHMDQLAACTGLNAENLRIELRRWKRFNGVKAA
jgi:hypothetical protein